MRVGLWDTQNNYARMIHSIICKWICYAIFFYAESLVDHQRIHGLCALSSLTNWGLHDPSDHLTLVHIQFADGWGPSARIHLVLTKKVLLKDGLTNRQLDPPF